MLFETIWLEKINKSLRSILFTRYAVTSELAQPLRGRHAKQILARWKQTRRVHEVQEVGGEGREVFQERELFAGLNGRGSSKEGRRGGRGWAAAPSRYIDRSVARPFRILKGKFPFILSHGIIPRTSASRIAAQMENNVTFCSWQVSREMRAAKREKESALISAGNFGVSWKQRARDGIGSSTEFARYSTGYPPLASSLDIYSLRLSRYLRNVDFRARKLAASHRADVQDLTYRRWQITYVSLPL